MAKLRHLALHTADLEGTANFYKRVFEMEEVGRNPTQASDAIYLSDGTLNLTILCFKSPDAGTRFAGSSALGLSHIGFWVENLEETTRRLRDRSAEHVVLTEADQVVLKHGEDKWKGPDGVVLDVTEIGWTGSRPPSED